MVGDKGEPPWDGRRFCGACGCVWDNPARCQECGHVEFSLLPNVQYRLGWLKRQEQPVPTRGTVEQGELFGGRE